MGVKRPIDTEFWTDRKVVEMFSPEDKLFFLYILTNPHTTQLGIYEISPKQMAWEIGYSVEAVKVLIDRFEQKYGLIKFSPETSEIAIKNALRHNIVKGGKPVEDCILKEITNVKDHSLLSFIYDSLIKADNLNQSVKKILPVIKDNANDNDNDNDNDNERIVPRFVPRFVNEGLTDDIKINPKKKNIDLTNIDKPEELKAFLRGNILTNGNVYPVSLL